MQHVQQFSNFVPSVHILLLLILPICVHIGMVTGQVLLSHLNIAPNVLRELITDDNQLLSLNLLADFSDRSFNPTSKCQLRLVQWQRSNAGCCPNYRYQTVA